MLTKEVTTMDDVNLISKYDIGEFVVYCDDLSSILCIVAEIHFTCNKVFYTLKNYELDITLEHIDSVRVTMINDADGNIAKNIKEIWRSLLLEEQDSLL